MRIRRLRIGGFGNLRGDLELSSDRCNLVLEPNESGKSTLAAALLACLYGFPPQRASRHHPIKLRQRYDPWEGGAFVVEMELDRGGEAFVLRRDFAADTVEVREGRSGKEITDRFSRGRHRVDVGEALTGLTREDFVKCCLIGQQEMTELDELSRLTHVLQKMASTQEGDIAAGEAIAVLDRSVDQEYSGLLLKKGKVETEIARLEEEIASTRAALSQITERRSSSEAGIQELERVQASEASGESELRRLGMLHLRALQGETRQDLERARRDESELSRRRSEMEALAPFAEFPSEKSARLLELKGRIETLDESRRDLADKIEKDLRPELQRRLDSSRHHEGLEALTPDQIRSASDAAALLDDLWRQKLETRRRIRAERSRLVLSGADPSLVEPLRQRFGRLEGDDLEFLSRYSHRSVEIERALLDAQRARKSAETPLAGSGRSELLALSLGFLGIVAAIVMWFTLEPRLLLLIPAAAALGGFFWWFWLIERRPVHGAEQFGTKQQQVQTELWAREKELAEIRERLAGVSSRLEATSPGRALEDFERLEALEEEIAPLSEMQGSLEKIIERYGRLAGELYDLMRQAGYRPDRGAVTPRTIRSFRAALADHIETRASVESLRHRIEQQERSLAGVAEDLDRHREELDRILLAGLGEGYPAGDIALCVERFCAGAQRRQEHDRLRDEVLPSLLGSHAEPPERRVASLEPLLASLDRQIAEAIAADASLEPLEADEPAGHYARLRSEAEDRLRRDRVRKQELLEHVGDILKQYRREYPAAVARLEELREALDGAKAFRESVGIAREVLTEISRKAYTEWAEALNGTTSEILGRLNPGYEDVRFDADLRFTVRDRRAAVRRDQHVVDAHFSAGARDQIYLAVRLALSRHLSSPEARLPLILDDPFASFDDERFDRAMRFLLDLLAEEHQILLLSCHVQRHEQWRRQAGAELADRLVVVGLPTA